MNWTVLAKSIGIVISLILFAYLPVLLIIFVLTIIIFSFYIVLGGLEDD